jgi:hypothetical protein
VTSHLSVYERLLGDRYRDLPPAVQVFHRLSGTVHLNGAVTVGRGEAGLGDYVARFMRLPKPAATRPFTFILLAGTRSERWTRCFESGPLTSTVASADPYLTERIGLLTWWYEVQTANEALTMRLVRVTAFGCPLPAFLVPQVFAIERGTGDRFHFDVTVRWPGARRLISYCGELDLRSATECR